jgi:DNA/RNA-binding domain of Phe-tRNA-synthetase-like protein
VNRVHVDVNWSSEVSGRFPGLQVCVAEIRGVCNVEANEAIRRLSAVVCAEVRGKYSVEALKDELTVRAYRDFYWRLDVDPTKTRPSGEALLRRVLRGGELPRISTVVDAYNLASMSTIVPVSGFDLDRVSPPFEVRFAGDESFRGIGMDRPMRLAEGTLVLADKHGVLCVYPYRDSDHSRITLSTRNVLVVAYGCPGIVEDQLRVAVESTLSYIRQTSGGEVASMRVFSA